MTFMSHEFFVEINFSGHNNNINIIIIIQSINYKAHIKFLSLDTLYR